MLANHPRHSLTLLVPCCLAGWCISWGNDESPTDTLVEHRSGLTVKPVYIGEVFSNTRGGISTKDATRYLGLLNLGMTLDCNALSQFLPGKFFLLAQNTHGQGLTTSYVGDSLFLSNIDADRDIMQVSEYWWECSPLDENVTLRIGKQDFNTEFLAIDTASHFIQSTFGLSPSTAFPTFPNQSMGAVAVVQLTESWKLKSGVWDAFSRGGSWGFSGNGSVVIAGELEYAYTLSNGQLPGILDVGAVRESGEVLDGRPISPVYEYIFQFEQAIYREPGSEVGSDQGWSIFAGFYPRFSDGEVQEDSIGSSVVAGLVCTGLLDGRDRDSFGLGLARSELYRGGSNQEKTFELYYRAQLSPRMSLQPDIQYITTPSGIYRDALAVGTRMQIAW
jgi:porin